jgi:hypothetical protein
VCGFRSSRFGGSSITPRRAPDAAIKVIGVLLSSWGGLLLDTYPDELMYHDVSCMYPGGYTYLECILTKTCSFEPTMMATRFHAGLRVVLNSSSFGLLRGA